MELYIHSPNTPSWHSAQLNKKHRDNFTFTFYTKHKHCGAKIEAVVLLSFPINLPHILP
jgi:hypothetical protein